MEEQSDQTQQTFTEFYDKLSNPNYNLPTWNNAQCFQKVSIIVYWIAITLPVLIVVILIPTVYVIYLVYYIIPQIGNSDDTPELYFWHTHDEHKSARAKAWILLIIFSILTAILIISLVKAIFTSPGTIPEDQYWQLDSEDSEEIGAKKDILEKRKDGLSRVCYACQKYKPDRAHHCRICERCVVKMDHHCPWIANCVGFFNYKYFFLSVGYSAVLLTIFTATFWESVVIYLNDDETGVAISFMVLVIYSLCALLNLAVVGFWTFHWYLILSGFTTLEYCEKRTKAYLYKDGSPYNFGFIRNLKAALGNNALNWFIPLGQYRDSTEEGVAFDGHQRQFFANEEDLSEVGEIL